MVTVDRLEDSDRSEWQRLYRAYAEFYRRPMPAETLELVWSWLHDESHESNALVARDAQSLVGLAHFREFSRPLAGTKGLFLDDLFVDPDARGAGIGQSLLTAISEEALSRGCQLFVGLPLTTIIEHVRSITVWPNVQCGLPTI